MKISKACFSHPLKIGIDARMFGLEHAGIGRYVENLVLHLLTIDKENSYVLFVRKAVKDEIDTKILRYEDIRCRIVVAEARHYSLKEQFIMPYLIRKEKIDLMHFPHFNVPVLFFGNFVVTIHDLIKHTSRGTTTTTRTPLFYWLKYFGYLVVFWLGVKRAKKILVPSKTIALQLREVYGVPEDKVVVTYEGVDDKLKVKSEKSKVKDVLEKYNVKRPFLIYVGSVYPHKNILNLIKSVKIVNLSLITNHQPASPQGGSPITLVIVCARNVFWKRLKEEVESQKAGKSIKLVGFVPDEGLQILYKEAEAFVFPSESEGFGLPGLEAMACGLPVLASDIPVFKEIYQNAALYFDPKNPKDIAKKISDFLFDKKLQEKLRKSGIELAAQYSYLRMARETLGTYIKTKG